MITDHSQSYFADHQSNLYDMSISYTLLLIDSRFRDYGRKFRISSATRNGRMRDEHALRQ